MTASRIERVDAADLNDVIDRTLFSAQPTPVDAFVVDLEATDSSSTPPSWQGPNRPLLIGVASEIDTPGLSAWAEAMTFTIAQGGTGPSWVNEPIEPLLTDLATVLGTGSTAATTLDRILRIGQGLSVDACLELESLAYSMLLASREFRTWNEDRDRPTQAPNDKEVVTVERDGDTLSVSLNQPERSNAFHHEMRDQLIEALTIATFDDSITRVNLAGAGRCFSAGGDLAEFGTAGDAAQAHVIRVEHSAGRLIHQLRDIVVPALHGACIGAGIEVPAFAGHLTAQPDTWFKLPEISMGLIPGAGGTVSIPRRIGRWRTAYMALTNRKITAATALEWGLVDELVS